MRFRETFRREAGQQTLARMVPGRPARAGIDPCQKLIVRHEDAISSLRAQADIAIAGTAREGGR